MLVCALVVFFSRPVLPVVVAAGYRECSLTAHPAVPPLRGLAPHCATLKLPAYFGLLCTLHLTSCRRRFRGIWTGRSAEIPQKWEE
eukprot:s1860_g11.t1